MIKRLLHIITGFFILLSILNSGCAKEYSYEGGSVPIIIDTTDTIIPPILFSWICPACIGKDSVLEGRWSFHDSSLIYCGIIDTAIVNPERTGFTFFGPSSCSIDTGMVISVFWDSTVLNKDLYNITSQQGAFYYYDNVGQTYILISNNIHSFTLTIDSYIHQSRMATGNFRGFVFKTNGDSVYISSGKFKVKLI